MTQHGTNHHNSSSKKAIIIGAGIAGLASAIRLAVKGFEVAVFEKNNYPGGKLTAFDLNGFKFDAGPSLFTQPGNIEDLFAIAKEPIEEYFTYTQVPVVCKYLFENGKQVEATADREQFAVNMQNAFGEDPNAIREYLLSSEKTYKNIGAFFVNHSLHKCKTYFNRQAFKAFKNTKFNFVFKTLHNYNRSKFRSAEAVQIFDRYATYNGSNP
jgi:phytoene dehydrogenase-like protein